MSEVQSVQAFVRASSDCCTGGPQHQASEELGCQDVAQEASRQFEDEGITRLLRSFVRGVSLLLSHDFRQGGSRGKAHKVSECQVSDMGSKVPTVPGEQKKNQLLLN